MPKSFISISAQFPTDLAQAARVEAARRNVSRAELIRKAVAEYLKLIPVKPTSTGQPNKREESANANT